MALEVGEHLEVLPQVVASGQSYLQYRFTIVLIQCNYTFQYQPLLWMEAASHKVVLEVGLGQCLVLQVRG